MNKKEKLFSFNFVFLIALGTVTSTAFNLVQPTLSKYAIQIGASVSTAGVIVGLFAAVALLARPFGGLLSDMMHKKRLLISSTAIITVATFGYSLSSSVPALAAFRLLHGAAFAVSSTVNVVFVSCCIPKSRLGEGIGYYGLAQIFANAAGPGIGLSLSERFGFETTFRIASLLLVAATLLMLLIRYAPEERSLGGERKKLRLNDLIYTKILPFAVTGGLFSMLNGIISGYLVLLGDERGILNVGLYYTVKSLCLLAVRPVAGRLSDKTGIGKIVLPALVLVAVEAVLLGFASSLWMIIIAGILQALGQGSAQPALQAACLRALPPEKSGVASATFYLGADIGQGVGPMVAGVIVGTFGYTAMFLSVAAVVTAGIFIFAAYDKKMSVPMPQNHS